MRKTVRFIAHLPLGIVFAAGGLVLGLSEEPSAHTSRQIASGAISMANAIGSNSIATQAATLPLIGAAALVSNEGLSAAASAALMRVRAATIPDSPVEMAAEIDASSLPLDDGTEYASMLETLVDVDPLAAGMYSLDLSADLVLTNLMLQDQSRLRAAQNTGNARSAATTRRDAQPIDVPSDLLAAPTVEQRQRQDRLSNWLARFYRRDLDDAARFVRYAWDVGARNGVDPYLIVAVMSIESSLDPMAVSDKGARGLMQVLVSAHEEKFDPYGGPVKAHNPLVSIEVGTRILKRMIELTGSVEGALKHYVGAKYFKSDGGYGAKVISMRERVWSAAMGYRIPTRPDVASAIERANNAQAAFTARTQTAER